MVSTSEHIHFVTGKLAAPALEELLAELSAEAGFSYSVQVMPITVAALMSMDWIAPRLDLPDNADRVLLPGYCSGDLAMVQREAGRPVERGPRDFREIPRYLQHDEQVKSDYGEYDIEIIAEINHCPRRTLEEIVQEARRLAADGADVIDLGCEPGHVWSTIVEAVKALRDEGLRVSVDSFDPHEVALATTAGAELVLSVTSKNCDAAQDWGVEVVVMPDDVRDLASAEATLSRLAEWGVPHRFDPVLEPLSFGFAASLGRYLESRQRFPDLPMMMGIGNLSELTDVDSAGVNVLLLGICQELGIRSVLTTQVINWGRTSVRECDLARRLMHYAVNHQVLPKHLEPRLVVLRDPEIVSQSAEELAHLEASLRDKNYRIFAEADGLHLLNRDGHLVNADAFELFFELQSSLAGQSQEPLDASHAFYLGYELCKATMARTLGKNYRQDESLDWGFLTQEEPHRHLTSRREQRQEEGSEG